MQPAQERCLHPASSFTEVASRCQKLLDTRGSDSELSEALKRLGLRLPTTAKGELVFPANLKQELTLLASADRPQQAQSDDTAGSQLTAGDFGAAISRLPPAAAADPLRTGSRLQSSEADNLTADTLASSELVRESAHERHHVDLEPCLAAFAAHSCRNWPDQSKLRPHIKSWPAKYLFNIEFEQAALIVVWALGQQKYFHAIALKESIPPRQTEVQASWDLHRVYSTMPELKCAGES
ncbi:hypothetical protein WJX73_005737 [Symbiochloris irregularis]|uniref:Uncharacterized protein n=1 Tax=Symbiochloris irregularis TaxID=706552 RepID=A0AAW1P9C0_9CHLO